MIVSLITLDNELKVFTNVDSFSLHLHYGLIDGVLLLFNTDNDNTFRSHYERIKELSVKC